jgi:hypothetical protein
VIRGLLNPVNGNLYPFGEISYIRGRPHEEITVIVHSARLSGELRSRYFSSIIDHVGGFR